MPVKRQTGSWIDVAENLQERSEEELIKSLVLAAFAILLCVLGLVSAFVYHSVGVAAGFFVGQVVSAAASYRFRTESNRLFHGSQLAWKTTMEEVAR